TISDWDQITPQDFDHGSYWILTKGANPQYFYNHDPGVTFIISPTGSGSYSVSQAANSPSDMAQYARYQADALHTYAIGMQSYGPTATGGVGSSQTNPGLDVTLQLQPINFIPGASIFLPGVTTTNNLGVIEDHFPPLPAPKITITGISVGALASADIT